MNFPCDECIVGMVCKVSCGKIYEYIEYLDRRRLTCPDNIIQNKMKCLRLYHAVDRWEKEYITGISKRLVDHISYCAEKHVFWT